MNEEQSQQFGELLERVKSIKENTDKIPDFSQRLKFAEIAIDDMQPKVKRHERFSWIGIGVVGVFSALWTTLLALVAGHDSTWNSP